MGRKASVQSRAKQAPPPVQAGLADNDVDDASATPADLDDDLPPDMAATDNVGEQSVEINVEGLIAELESGTRKDGSSEVSCARRKLEDYLERRRVAQAIEDFEDFEV